MGFSNTDDELDKTFTTFHHEIAEQLGYKQTPGYASWDKVETTAPVQAIDRLVAYIKANYRHIDDIRGAIGEDVSLKSFGEPLAITDLAIMDDYSFTKGQNHAKDDIRQALNIGDK